MENRWSPIRVLVVVVSLIGIGWVWCWWWPRWCPICRPWPCAECAACAACEACEECGACRECEGCCEGAPAVSAQNKIVVDAIHTAIWMVTDNDSIFENGKADHFVCDDKDLGGATPTDHDKWGPCLSNHVSYNAAGWPDDYRPGVVFQTGTVLDPSGDYDHLDKVIVVHSGGTTDLDEPDFDWLDIRPRNSKCPIDPLHAYALFYDDPNQSQTQIQSGTECDGAKAVDGMGNPLAGSCLRNRALHSMMRANKDVVTFWPDPANLYDVRVEPHSHGSHPLVEFTFEFQEAATVDRWNEGCFKERYDDVTLVHLVYTDDHNQTHGGYHEPAIDGGRPTKEP